MARKEITTKQELKQELLNFMDRGGRLDPFSEKIGVSKWKLYKWTRDIRHILDLDDAIKIAEGLGYELKFKKNGGGEKGGVRADEPV